MAWVVLLKAANVGGRTFRPLQLVKELPDLELVSLGAAGTFVARARRGAAIVERTIRSKLPFDATIIVLPGPLVTRLFRADPGGAVPREPGTRRFVCFASAPPDRIVRLPIEVPEGGEWQVRIGYVEGPFVVGQHRRRGPRLIYPTEVVERLFGVPVTTRWWETLEAVVRALPGRPAGSAFRPDHATRPRTHRGP